MRRLVGYLLELRLTVSRPLVIAHLYLVLGLPEISPMNTEHIRSLLNVAKIPE